MIKITGYRKLVGELFCFFPDTTKESVWEQMLQLLQNN